MACAGTGKDVPLRLFLLHPAVLQDAISRISFAAEGHFSTAVSAALSSRRPVFFSLFCSKIVQDSSYTL